VSEIKTLRSMASYQSPGPAGAFRKEWSAEGRGGSKMVLSRGSERSSAKAGGRGFRESG